MPNTAILTMPDAHTLHDAATWYMTGVIWLVQLVQYPMFAHLDRTTFNQSHAFHTSAIATVVMPAMLLELACAAILAFRRPDPATIAGLALVGVIWAMTFFVIVPLHNRLGSEGFSSGVHVALVQWNWVRTLAWSARSGLILFGLLPK